ncbi:MAG: J domain-containing protein [Bacteroidetes bacterium]|nr:J domain-containing protein [Bacteroidota bacterium]
MEYKDYYKVLGIPKDADADTIKQAYRRLARQYHPDVNPGDATAEARFKDVNEAYEVLSNPETRQQYDELGSNWQQQRTTRDQGWQQAPDDFGGGTYGGFGGGGFSDFFRTFFGNRGGFHEAEEPLDLKAKLTISLKEAYLGGPKHIKMGDEQFRIELKPGTREGQTLRLRGKGRPGPGGKRGDLYLQLSILPDPLFEQESDDLYTQQSASLFTAVLGGPMRVRTLGGELLEVKLKPGTSGGTTVRLRGKGMPKADGTHGDLYLTVQIQVPQKLTDAQRAQFEQLRQSLGETQ